MDSVTQATLGAAVGEAVLGRKIGNKAALYGAVLATLPDLDVLIPMNGPVADFTYHRSWSHSLLLLTAVTPVIATAIHRWRKDPPGMRTRWMVLVFLVLISHALLDAMTIYGTQLLWPLTDHPFGLGAIFIIDPLYTVPLLLGVLCALFMTRRRSRGHLLNRAGLAVSSLYLVWTLIAQSQADAVARRTLQANGVAFERILTIPAPLNTLLWRTIAILPDGRHYMIGYQSFLDGADSAIFERYPAGHTLAAQLAGHWPVDRLITFTKGFYRARLEGETLVVSDLRMGIEGRYAFEFEVGKRAGSSSELRVVPVPDKRKQEQRSTEGVGRLWARIWDPGVEIVPVATAGQ